MKYGNYTLSLDISVSEREILNLLQLCFYLFLPAVLYILRLYN